MVGGTFWGHIYCLKNIFLGFFSKKNCPSRCLKTPKRCESLRKSKKKRLLCHLSYRFSQDNWAQISDFPAFYAPTGRIFCTFGPRGRGLVRCGNIATARAHHGNHGKRNIMCKEQRRKTEEL